MTESAFKARDIGLRAQKKILSRMAGKNIARAFIDDTTASLLDNLYRLAKQYVKVLLTEKAVDTRITRKKRKKLIKNIIKVVIKLGVLHRNNMLSEDELRQAEKFKTKFRMAGMAIISFYEVDFSYDRNYVANALSESQKCLEVIVSKHLTEKSLSRIESVFSFFSNEQFLDAIFKRDSEYREALGRVVSDLNKAIDSGDL
ncbi:hypothetical protein NQ318_010146 [Aromia moschata]|uniref:Tumor necrosis factor alpha-induced protein 8-like protein n=1 Tax=Aromia moschata TaxID=1265417 RepID=A0AAV8XQ46_9CUCU|nr:hypothetical protein NQ318_010146 [Aromia moschata]